jgi:Asp-tRNA(Asn)/Glu-tRNA(Gln) amidotransferase A subunit family amidase
MEDFELIVERHNLILAFDAAKVHQSWFGSFSEKYHPKTSQLIRRGETISQTAYQQALSDKDELRSSLVGTMDQHKINAWITPSAPGPAPQGLESTGDPVMNLPWTQSGFPTVTLPSGKTAEGLPLGLQVIAQPEQDESLLAWAVQIEPLLEFESMHGLEDYLAQQH